jgi:hypothetical protein
MKLFRKHLHTLGVGVLLSGLAISATAGLASAQPWYNGPPPPPPRYENHGMRAGYAWEGGHWRRANGRWVWASGRYVTMAPGLHWVTGHWRMGPQGRYWVDGHWG